MPIEQEAGQIGPVDLLLMPIDGVYTIDPAQAVQTAERLKPGITIPMHYKTSKCGLPLAKVEDFTSEKSQPLRSLKQANWRSEKKPFRRTPKL